MFFLKTEKKKMTINFISSAYIHNLGNGKLARRFSITLLKTIKGTLNIFNVNKKNEYV